MTETTKLLKHFFERFDWEDYDHSENNGHVDHSGYLCKVCSTAFDDDMGKQQRAKQCEHLFGQHKEEVRLHKSQQSGGEE